MRQRGNPATPKLVAGDPGHWRYELRESARGHKHYEHGDDKDRVIERSDGEHTYFASDIAYHENKRERGFDRLIDVWGADHHGYVQRMKVAFQALGGDPDRLELLIMQFVNLVERGERASMSKRSGEFVTLDDLVTEIGVDAARWFLLQRSHDTTIDLDLQETAHKAIESVLKTPGGPAAALVAIDVDADRRPYIFYIARGTTLRYASRF